MHLIFKHFTFSQKNSEWRKGRRKNSNKMLKQKSIAEWSGSPYLTHGKKTLNRLSSAEQSRTSTKQKAKRNTDLWICLRKQFYSLYYIVVHHFRERCFLSSKSFDCLPSIQLPFTYYTPKVILPNDFIDKSGPRFLTIWQFSDMNLQKRNNSFIRSV